MDKNKNNLTLLHLIRTVELVLSERHLNKFTMTLLKERSGKSRSTVYYHFSISDEALQCLFEEHLIKRVIVDCSGYDDVVKSVIHFILSNQILCLNLYHQSEFMHRQNYLLNLFADAFNKYELSNDKLKDTERHLLSGIVYILEDWIENDFKTAPDIIIMQLITHGQIVRQYKS